MRLATLSAVGTTLGLMVTVPLVPLVGQTGIREYDTCTQDPNDTRDIRDLDRRLFACSRIVGDSTLPADIRAKAYTQRGRSYWRRPSMDPSNANRSDYDQAIADFTEAIRLNAKQTDAYFLRGRVYFAGKKNYDRAIDDFTEAIRRNVQFQGVSPYQFRANAYEIKGDKERAIADYRKALSINRSDWVSKDGLVRLGAVP